MTQNKFICDCDVIHEEDVLDTKERIKNQLSYAEKLPIFFKVLGDGTRIKILLALDKNELCVCDIANVLNMSKSSISHQLKILRDNRIVKARRQGKEVFYSLDDNHVRQVFELAYKHIEHSTIREMEK